MKRIGILGGTFNPIHIGHLVIAQNALEKLSLDKIIFVPSYAPVHKSTKGLAPAKDRLAMVSLAVKNNPGFEASDREVKQGRKIYSIQTVQSFREQYGQNTKLFFIIGGDEVESLHKWKRIYDLFKMVTFVGVNRPGFNNRQQHHKTRRITAPHLDVSSSYIRRCLVKGTSVKYLLTQNVLNYILKKKLYTSK